MKRAFAAVVVGVLMTPTSVGVAQQQRGLSLPVIVVNVRMARHPRDGAAVRFAETARVLGGKKAPVKIVRVVGLIPKQPFGQRDAGDRIVCVAPLAKRDELGLVGTSARGLDTPRE